MSPIGAQTENAKPLIAAVVSFLPFGFFLALFFFLLARDHPLPPQLRIRSNGEMTAIIFRYHPDVLSYPHSTERRKMTICGSNLESFW